MNKKVILITGTPCVGKTIVAQRLSSELKADYINLTELAEKNHLARGKDKERDTMIIDEHKMRRKIKEIVDKTENNNVVIDGHFAAAVTSKTIATHVFVLRRNPTQLREFMQKCGFSPRKQSENLAAEILDICLIEAVNKHPKEHICELDISDRTVEEILNELLAFLDGRKKCCVGCVDWIGMLEQEGKLDEYLEK
jgi:adenylate kinase